MYASERKYPAQARDNAPVGMHVKLIADPRSGAHGLQAPLTSALDEATEILRPNARQLFNCFDPASEGPAPEGPLLNFAADKPRFAMQHPQAEMTGPPARIRGDVCEYTPDICRWKWKDRFVGGLDWCHGPHVMLPAPRLVGITSAAHQRLHKKHATVWCSRLLGCPGGSRMAT